MFPTLWSVGVIPVAAAIGLGAACGRISPTEPVELIDQAWCAEANPELTQFRSCVLGRRNCPKTHKWWMRGQVTCGPVDDDKCGGGRCCNYRPQYDPSVGEPDEDWAPPGFAKPAQPPKTTETPVEPATDPPAPSNAEPGTPPPITVVVALAGDGTASIVGDTLTPEAVRTRLCEIAKALPDVAVSVHAQADTPQAVVLSVVDIATACGINAVAVEQTTD